jgi:hypothetical protein
MRHVRRCPFPLLYRSRSHFSTPTPISAHPAFALPHASLCLPWPPPTRQTAMPECPSNRVVGFTSPGSHAAHRPGHRPPRPSAHASAAPSAFSHQAQLKRARPPLFTTAATPGEPPPQATHVFALMRLEASLTMPSSMSSATRHLTMDGQPPALNHSAATSSSTLPASCCSLTSHLTPPASPLVYLR